MSEYWYILGFIVKKGPQEVTSLMTSWCQWFLHFYVVKKSCSVLFKMMVWYCLYSYFWQFYSNFFQGQILWNTLYMTSSKQVTYFLLDMVLPILNRTDLNKKLYSPRYTGIQHGGMNTFLHTKYKYTRFLV